MRLSIGPKFRAAGKLAVRLVDEYSADNGDLLAAALAFYTLLSLAPLVIIAVAIAGTLLGAEDAHGEVIRLLEQTMGGSAATTIKGWIEEAARSGAVASVVGAVLSLLAASRLFGQLKDALNQIFDVPVASESVGKAVKTYLKRRVFAFAMVLAAGAVLLVVVISRTVLAAISSTLFDASRGLGAGLLGIAQVAFSLVAVGALAASVFKVVPDTKVPWRAAFAGGALTSVLFNVGNVLVGMYLSRAAATFATYGAAGSLVVVLVWFYFSAQFLVVGAELAQIVSVRATSAERAPLPRETRTSPAWHGSALLAAVVAPCSGVACASGSPPPELMQPVGETHTTSAAANVPVNAVTSPAASAAAACRDMSWVRRAQGRRVDDPAVGPSRQKQRESEE